MNEAEFSSLLPKLRPWSDYLYFHLMGEPLCHPLLPRFLELAGEAGFRVILTTNGSLLDKKKEFLLHSPALHKVNISLHAFEANDSSIPFDTYLSQCFSYGLAAQGKKQLYFVCGIRVVQISKTPRFLLPWKPLFQSRGPKNAEASESEIVYIWHTEINSIGQIFLLRMVGIVFSAMVCGTK